MRKAILERTLSYSDESAIESALGHLHELRMVRFLELRGYCIGSFGCNKPKGVQSANEEAIAVVSGDFLPRLPNEAKAMQPLSFH
jgi:hypothetical protein